VESAAIPFLSTPASTAPAWLGGLGGFSAAEAGDERLRKLVLQRDDLVAVFLERAGRSGRAERLPLT
jgi:hypothetical protein